MASMQGPQAKLERANEHVALFESEIRNLINPASYSVVVESDDVAGKDNWCFKSPTPFVPLKLSAILGDALFNFRSALDQIVWQLVLANNKTPDVNNSFPIFLANEFDTKKGNSLEGISDTAIQIIKSFQPKPGTNCGLLFLPKLNNIDKHRHLHLFVVYIPSSTAVFDSNVPMSEGDVVEAFSCSYYPLISGTILFSIPKKYKPRFFLPRFDIGFCEEIGINKPVLEILKDMSEQIKGIFSVLESEVNKGKS